jgi:hypothetical protein
MTPTLLPLLTLLLSCAPEAEEALGPPLLVARPMSVDFGTTSAGQPVAQSIWLSNTGDIDLTIHDLELAGPFSTDAAPGVVAPGEAMEVRVAFEPVIEGAAQGHLRVVSDAQDRNELFVLLSGWGAMPRTEISPEGLSCELDGVEVEEFLTITNRGEGDLIVSAALEGGGGAFSMGETLEGVTLSAGASRQVPIRCQSTTYARGRIVVTTNDPGNPAQILHLYAETARLDGEITSHSDGDTVDESKLHDFIAAIRLVDDHDAVLDPSLYTASWYSAALGDLGATTFDDWGRTALFNVSLPVGRDTLTFVARGPDDQEVIEQITLTIDDAPRLAVPAPIDGGWWPSDAGPVTLWAAVSDESDPIDALTVSWSSDRAGDLGSLTPDADGRASLEATLSTGWHQLTATVTNPRGLSDTRTVDLEVLDCGDSADADGDGYSIADGDCDDNDPAAFPGADAALGDPRGACLGGLVAVDAPEDEDSFGDAMAAGDLDGDGLAELIVGAPELDTAESNDGALFLVSAATPGEPLAVVFGAARSDKLGEAVLAVPDQDGDGQLEVAVSAPGAGGGETYLFYGRSDWGGLEPDDAELVVRGLTDGDEAGATLAAGDFDGDGVGDLAIGAPDRYGGDGEVYVLLGDQRGELWVEVADMTLSPTTGSPALGSALAAGDFDGDGRDDLVVGAPDDASGVSGAGAAWLLLEVGRGSDEVAATWLGGRQDAELGEGGTLSALGDVDGDGRVDLMLAAPGFEAIGVAGEGAAFLVYGSPLVEGTSNIDAAAGASWGAPADQTLDRVALAGVDLDRDGLADPVLGLYRDDPEGAKNGGTVRALYSSARPGWGSLAALDADLTLSGAENEGAGEALLGAADMDGDGARELAVKADMGLHLYLSGPTCDP